MLTISKRFQFIMKRITKAKDKSDKLGRVTRKKASSTVVTLENDETAKRKPDLAKFAMKTRSKLQRDVIQANENAQGEGDLSGKSLEVEASAKEQEVDVTSSNVEKRSKTRTKREHVKIEYEPVSKIKKEVEGDKPCTDYETKVECKQDLQLIKREICDKSPLNWEVVLNNLREMRKNSDAPVDSMGCHKCHDEEATPEAKRYQQLLSLMLSSQTKDQVTHAAMQRLLSHGCTIENILATSNEKLGELIYPVSFWKSKVKFIKRTTEMLRTDFNADIPNTVKDLCTLPGVGPKMSHICMQTAWGQVTGIGVDTHVHRISNRLGWVKTKTPEDTRKALEAWLPRDLWSEVNLILVGFGQQICQPMRPQCATCLNYELCPFGVKYLNGEFKGKKISKA